MCTGLNLKSDGYRVIVFQLLSFGEKNKRIQVLYLSRMWEARGIFAVVG